MTNKSYLFTSESVSAGHPDKIADQISDLVLDYFLTQDITSRVAAETFVTPKRIILAGEFRANFAFDSADLEQQIHNLIKEIGYISGIFSDQNVAIEIDLNKQSADIARGVDEGSGKDKAEGAGDQGLMFGYACRETKALMPAPIYYAHKILEEIYANLKAGQISGFGPDAKSQVTFKYENGQPVAVDTILLSIQHEEQLSEEQITAQVKPLITKLFPAEFLTNTKFLFNPTGKFVIGGPEGDAGLTGRKIIVDTYGGAAPHGGGAFSGKDPTKVDRSAAYMARYLAKNVVAAGLADKCLIQLAYGIGIAEPISFMLDSFGTAKIADQKITDYLTQHISMTPKAIRTRLNLNAPIFKATATYGHFGRDYNAATGEFSWENCDLIADLQSLS